MTEPTTSRPSDPASRRWLKLAAAVCVLESAALLALASVVVADLSTSRLVLGLTTTIFLVAYAAGLAAAAWGLARARSWARAPLMLAELIQLGIAWNFHGPRTDWLAALLAASAIFVVVVLLLPATTLALYGGTGRDNAPVP